MNDTNDSTDKRNVRAEAFSELCKYAGGDVYVNIALDGAIKRLGMRDRDRDFFTALIYGVTERQLTLDYYISKLSSKPITKLDLSVLVALRMGVYQILYMDKVPDSAACNESVKLVKKHTASAAPFVNAVLRSFIRRRGDIELPNPEKQFEKYLSVRYSVPEKLIFMWDKMYGRDQTEKILRGMDAPPALTLRINTLKIKRDELISRLTKSGIEAVPSPESRDGIRLVAPVPISSLDCLSAGLCTVQDDASSLSVEALDPNPGDTVIDICSAPGGKSFSAAMLMEGRGRIRSFDIYESKLELIRGGAMRLGIGIIEAEKSDGKVFREELEESADCVICDVPCSGLGVLAKKPDMRCRAADRVDDNGEGELSELQYTILCNAARYLKKGGRMVYSTCTLNRAENEDVVTRFMSEHEGYEVKIIRTLFPDPEIEPFMRTDGFFYSLIVKI